MKRAPYPSPCDRCTKAVCQDVKCADWQRYFRYHWKLINLYAKKHGITPTT